MTKKPKSVKSRRRRISIARHDYPAFSADNWRNGSHAERTEMTLEYIRAFDTLNSFVSGNTYTFGGVAA